MAPFIGKSLSKVPVNLDDINGFGGAQDIRAAYGYPRIDVNIKNRGVITTYIPPIVAEQFHQGLFRRKNPNTLIMLGCLLAHQLDYRLYHFLYHPDSEYLAKKFKLPNRDHAKKFMTKYGVTEATHYLTNQRVDDVYYAGTVTPKNDVITSTSPSHQSRREYMQKSPQQSNRNSLPGTPLAVSRIQSHHPIPPQTKQNPHQASPKLSGSLRTTQHSLPRISPESTHHTSILLPPKTPRKSHKFTPQIPSRKHEVSPNSPTLQKHHQSVPKMSPLQYSRISPPQTPFISPKSTPQIALPNTPRAPRQSHHPLSPKTHRVSSLATPNQLQQSTPRILPQSPRHSSVVSSPKSHSKSPEYTRSPISTGDRRSPKTSSRLAGTSLSTTPLSSKQSPRTARKLFMSSPSTPRRSEVFPKTSPHLPLWTSKVKLSEFEVQLLEKCKSIVNYSIQEHLDSLTRILSDGSKCTTDELNEMQHIVTTIVDTISNTHTDTQDKSPDHYETDDGFVFGENIEDNDKVLSSPEHQYEASTDLSSTEAQFEKSPRRNSFEEHLEPEPSQPFDILSKHTVEQQSVSDLSSSDRQYKSFTRNLATKSRDVSIYPSSTDLPQRLSSVDLCSTAQQSELIQNLNTFLDVPLKSSKVVVRPEAGVATQKRSPSKIARPPSAYVVGNVDREFVSKLKPPGRISTKSRF